MKGEIEVENKIDDFKALIEEINKTNFMPNKKVYHLMPTLFNKSSDENFLSDWLAFIINPELNSIGTKPLNILLSLAGYNIFLSDDVKTDIGSAGYYSNCRECYLDAKNSCRIDFLFKVDDGDDSYLFAIENKIFSGQSRCNQLEDYCEKLNNISKINDKYKTFEPNKIIKIYLTIDGNKTDVIGTDFRSVSHKDFIGELKEIPLNFVDNMRESFLISEYIRNMEENVMCSNDKNLQITNEEIAFFESNSEKIDEIYERREKFYEEIKKYIFNKVNEIFDENEFLHKYCPSYALWYKKSWANGEFSNLHYEILFNKNYKSDMIVDVVLHDETSEIQREENYKIFTNCPNDKPMRTVEKRSVKQYIKQFDDVDKLANSIKESMIKIIEKYDKFIDECKYH